MKIINRTKANKGKKVLLNAGNMLNTEVVLCIKDNQFIQLQTDRTLKIQRKIQWRLKSNTNIIKSEQKKRNRKKNKPRDT
jgi:hypothetical protein